MRELMPVARLLERVAPGDVMPAGECPECGALCVPVEQDEDLDGPGVWVSLGRFTSDGDEHGADPRSRLLGCIRINGVRFHVRAIEVEGSPAGEQRAKASPAGLRVWDDEFSELYAAHRCDGAVQVVSYGGRHYALFLSPYC